MASSKRERKNVKFTAQHPDLPRSEGGKFASRTAWAKMKKDGKTN